MTERQALEKHYRATGYRARTPRGAMSLRIGLESAALAALLAEYSAADWAFISASNPRSVPAPRADNEAAQRRLLQRLRDCGAIVFSGEGIADGDAWEPEHSYLALDIPRQRALALAREFSQHAILAGRAGGPAELVWTRA